MLPMASKRFFRKNLTSAALVVIEARESPNVSEPDAVKVRSS